MLNRSQLIAGLALILLLTGFLPLLAAAGASPGSKSTTAEGAVASSDTYCVSNGFLSAQVSELDGMYTFDLGSCASATSASNYILFPIGTSFVTVADFSTGAYYTEAGLGKGTSLGTPTGFKLTENSIAAVFPQTLSGLVVIQNITVIGGNYSDSAILMDVNVVNTGAVQQKVGIRYLWDAQVGGFDGTWMQEYDGKAAGSIVGYETNYSPLPANFTSYGMSGCSQNPPPSAPPYTCDPSDFGSGAGTFTVFGSISEGVGVTTPVRFVFGWWMAMYLSAYGYVTNPLNEVGSYARNIGGSQDSAMLYYFSNETLSTGGGSLSDQADVTTSPPATGSSGSSGGSGGSGGTGGGAGGGGGGSSPSVGLDAQFWKETFFGNPIASCVSERSPSAAGVEPSTPPTAVEVDPNIAHGISTAFSWDETSPGFTVNGVTFFDTSFSVEWTGYIHLNSSTTYRFRLTSDDGSWLYINTTPRSTTISSSDLVLNDGGRHSARTSTSSRVTVTTSGYYPIEVQYYETCGGRSGIDLSWAVGSSHGFSIIPSSAFKPALIGSDAAPSQTAATSALLLLPPRVPWTTR